MECGRCAVTWRPCRRGRGSAPEICNGAGIGHVVSNAAKGAFAAPQQSFRSCMAQQDRRGGQSPPPIRCGSRPTACHAPLLATRRESHGSPGGRYGHGCPWAQCAPMSSSCRMEIFIRRLKIELPNENCARNETGIAPPKPLLPNGRCTANETGLTHLMFSMIWVICGRCERWG